MKHTKQVGCKACEKALQREANQAFPMPNAEQRVAKLHNASLNRQDKDDAMRSLGLSKVRGALGGVYWE